MSSKQNLITHLAELSGETKAAVGRVLDALASHTHGELYAGQEVLLPEIGKLKPAKREARDGHHPKTGETVRIEAKRLAKFTAAKALKDAIN